MSEMNNNTNVIKLQDPDEQIKPRVTKETVPDVVCRLYGLKVDKFKELPSYDDLNFLVRVTDTWENRNITAVNKDGYVLKILNSLQSSQPVLIEAQIAMCQYVRDRGIPTQVPVLNKDGDEWSIETFPGSDGAKVGPYLVRLVTFVPGKIFFETPYIPLSFYKVGKFVGRLHQALTGFHHSFYDSHSMIWSLTQVPVLRDFVHAVTEVEDAAIVREVITEFERQVVPKYNQLTKGVIHGDLNEQNLIMTEVPDQDNIPRDQRVHDVSAILDFSDVTDSYIVMDVAICIAYLSIECPEEPDRCQIDVGGHVLAGYYKHCSHNTEEFNSLKILVCARLCQSLVLGAHSYAQQPGNKYLLTTAKRGWPLLRQLWRVEDHALHSRWNEIIESYQTNTSI